MRMQFEEIVAPPLFFLWKSYETRKSYVKLQRLLILCGTIAPLVQKGLECDVARKSSVKDEKNAMLTFWDRTHDPH